MDLAPVTVPVSLSAGPRVCNSLLPVPATAATSWSATTREVLDTMLVRPSTKRQYAIYWRKFVLFCNREEVNVFPLDINVVADFMTSLAKTTRSK